MDTSTCKDASALGPFLTFFSFPSNKSLLHARTHTHTQLLPSVPGTYLHFQKIRTQEQKKSRGPRSDRQSSPPLAPSPAPNQTLHQPWSSSSFLTSTGKERSMRRKTLVSTRRAEEAAEGFPGKLSKAAVGNEGRLWRFAPLGRSTL